MRMIAEVIASAFSSGLSWRGSLGGKEVYCPPPGLTGPSGYGRLRPGSRRQSRMADKRYGRGYGGVAQPSVSLRRPMNERGQVDLQDNLATKFPSCWRALGAGGLGGTTGCVTRSPNSAARFSSAWASSPSDRPRTPRAVMKMCGEQWQAAKAAETTNGETWLLFLAQCRTQQTGGGAAPAAPTMRRRPQHRRRHMAKRDAGVNDHRNGTPDLHGKRDPFRGALGRTARRADVARVSLDRRRAVERLPGVQ